jgi:hypothetical protein
MYVVEPVLDVAQHRRERPMAREQELFDVPKMSVANIEALVRRRNQQAAVANLLSRDELGSPHRDVKPEQVESSDHNMMTAWLNDLC